MGRCCFTFGVFDPRSISQLSWQHQLVRLGEGVIFSGCSGFLSTWLVVSPPKELDMAREKIEVILNSGKSTSSKRVLFLALYIYIYVYTYTVYIYINFTGSYLMLTVNVGCSLLEFLYFTS